MARYYPLIDCTSDGVEKFPMFFSNNFFNAVGTGFVLMSDQRNRYRLKAMDIIGPHETKLSLALYACAECE